MPKRTVRSAKKGAWKEFSKYIRLRDCLKTTSTQTRGKCITCRREYPFEKLQAGHFLSGRGATILFHEDLVNAQCYGCNVMKGGNPDEYWPIMLEKYGQKQIDEWRALKRKTHRWTIEELDEIKAKYKEEFEFIRDNNS